MQVEREMCDNNGEGHPLVIQDGDFIAWCLYATMMDALSYHREKLWPCNKTSDTMGLSQFGGLSSNADE